MSQKKRVSSRSPGVKADATKRDHETGSHRPKTAQTTGLAQQSLRNGYKKKEVASTERPHLLLLDQVLEKQSLLQGTRTTFLKIMANPIKQSSM